MEHPLNWILIMIAGAFFLLLFVALIKSVTTNARNSEGVRSISRLEATIEASQGDPSTISEYELPEFISRCDGLGADYTVEIGSQQLEYPYLAIFSPEEIGAETIIWSEEFAFPSPILTVTYLFPSTTLLLLDADLPSKIRDLFDDRVTTKTYTGSVTGTDIRGFNPIIVVSSAPNAPVGELDAKSTQHVYGVQISTSATEPLRTGTAEYYTYASGFHPITGGLTLPYYSEALLVGAIAATTDTRYLCALEVVDERMKFIATIHKERLSHIDPSAFPGLCESAVTELNTNLDTLTDPNTNLYETNDMYTYDAARADIAQWNTALRRQSCPIMY